MRNETHPVVEKALAITESYLRKWGRVMIGVYRFPEVETKRLTQFFDSLKTALMRKDQLPSYLWIHDSRTQSYTLVLWINGFCRTNLDDLWPVITRLWRRYSPYSFQQQDTFLVTAENYSHSLGWFGAFLLAIGGTQTGGKPIASGLHRRSYGASQL